MSLGDMFRSIRVELRSLGLVYRSLVLFFGLLLITVVLQRLVIAPRLRVYAGRGDLWGLTGLIFFNNLLAFASLVVAGYIFFYQSPLVSVERCRVVWLRDCGFWRSLLVDWKVRLYSGLVFATLLVLAMVYNSVHVYPNPHNIGLLDVLVVGVSRVYGILELSGYYLAVLSQVPGSLYWKVLLPTLGVYMLFMGALVEASYAILSMQP